MGGEHKEFEDMTQAFLWLLNQAKTHGISLVILVFVSGLFWHEKTKLDVKVDTLMETLLDRSEEEKILLKTVVQENTRAIDRNTRILQKITGDMEIPNR